MKLATGAGYWSAGPPAGRPEQLRGGGAARVRLDLDGGGLRLRRAHAARVVGRRDRRGSSSARRSASCRPARPPPRRWPRSPSTTSPAAGSSSASARPGPQVVEGWYGAALPQAAGAHPRVRRDRAPGRRPRGAGRASTASTTSCRCAGGDRPRQAAQVDRAPAARRHPDLPRRRGPEERRAGGRDRRRLAADVLLAEVRRRSTATRSPRGSPRPGARRAPDDFEVACARCRSSSATTSRPRPTSYRPMLALYIGGMGARGVNFHNDVFARMGYEGEAPTDPGPVPRGQEGRGRGRGADSSSSRTSRSSGRAEKIRDELAALAGVVRDDDARVRTAAGAAADGRAVPVRG